MLLSGKARIAGVIGLAVGHSRSPRLHGHWFGRYRVDGAYIPIPVRPEDVELAFRAMPRLGFRGWNVTVPHKEAAARLVDELDPAARRIGAVNTVLVLDDGRTRGLNTDGAGFLANLRQDAPAWRGGAGPAVVLGAGGRGAGGGRGTSRSPACRRCDWSIVLARAPDSWPRISPISVRSRPQAGMASARPSPTLPCWSTARASG